MGLHYRNSPLIDKRAHRGHRAGRVDRMKNQNEWLAEYSVSHQNPWNQWIHKLCVPAILLSLVGLLSLLRIPNLSDSPLLSLAPLVALPSLFFYFLLSWKAFFTMILAEVGCLLFLAWVEPKLPLPFVWYSVIFVLAWLGQAVGHAIEGRKPSFFKDLQFLLIGPLWVFGFGRRA